LQKPPLSLAAIISLLLLWLSLGAALRAELPPEPAREFRGAWVATVYNLNWPSRPGLPAAQQQRELRAILDRAVELRLNAILLQVRPGSDALYASKIEPWSAVLSGKMGRAPEPLYDPLAWAVQEAHARGLELHAWFNPFRALPSAGAATAPNHVTQTHPEWIRRYGGQLYIDPGEPEAREYVRSVLLDVVRRYDIDGVHIDDYFYPYPVKDKAGAAIPFPDEPSFQKYHRSGGTLPLDAWRRQNIDQFVETLNRSIKVEKRWVKFGISPFGIWRPRVPASIEAKLDSYAQLYADSKKWLNEGWCDYFSPQLYWSIEPAAQSFPVLLDWWRGQNTQGRHLWPGIAADRIGPARPASEIARQIALTRSGAKGPPGVVFWDMKSLMIDRGGIATLLPREVYPAAALVPASPWLGAEMPPAPRVTRSGGSVSWKPGGDVPARWWAVQVKRAGAWSLRVLPATSDSAPLEKGDEAVAVREVDRFGNASGPGILSF
jgi:uncharacterized lipoprotein YddW (UPF0748 family)